MLMRRRISIILAAVCMAAFCSCTFGGTNEETAQKTEFFAMDTYMSVTAYGESAQKAIELAKDEVQRLDKLWSVADESSEIYAVNSGGEVSVSGETAQLISFMLEMAKRTGGALEPTLYPVVKAWGFTGGENRVPSGDEIQELLKKVGYEKVSVSGNTVTIPSGVMLDTGAVGKGYASDKATEVLKENGVDSALIDLGGNIVLIGSKPDGKDWKIGVRDPEGDGVVGVISASDCAIVTSGAYERNFTAGGVVYGHIIDPKSGAPVDNDILSVTVIASEGRLCDALSTALFVMGKDKAVEHWRTHKDFDMIMLCKDGQAYVTEGIADRFEADEKHSEMKINVVEG